MHENVPVAARTALRLIEQARAGFLQALDSGVQVWNAQRNVMQALTALRQKPARRRG